MKRLDIWQSSNVAPARGNSMWLADGILKYYGPNGWTNIKVDVDIPEIVEPTEATTTKAGLVKQMPSEETLAKDATEKDIINKLNAVIVKMKAAGIMI